MGIIEEVCAKIRRLRGAFGNVIRYCVVLNSEFGMSVDRFSDLSGAQIIGTLTGRAL